MIGMERTQGVVVEMVYRLLALHQGSFLGSLPLTVRRRPLWTQYRVEKSLPITISIQFDSLP